MANKGFVLLHRQILDNKAFKNYQEAMAFALLVIKAAHTPMQIIYRGERINLERGELAMTVRDFAKKYDWSASKSFRFLEHLAKHKMIQKRNSQSKKVKQSATVISICNYNTYQVQGAAGEPARDKNRNNVETVAGTPTGTMNNKLYNNKNKNICAREAANDDSASPQADTHAKPKRRKANVKTAFPEGCVSIPDAFREYAIGKGHPEPEEEWFNFEDYCRANDKRYSDWYAAWRTWVRNSFKFGTAANRDRGGQKRPSAGSAMEAGRMALAEELEDDPFIL